MTNMVVVPWHREEEIVAFLEQWGIDGDPPGWLVLQHDTNKEGCGITKNRGIVRALEMGADIVVVLDGDCYPENGTMTLQEFVADHKVALEPQPVSMFEIMTDPPSRGTPYCETAITMPVAASMGFWTEVGDYCAIRQLAHSNTSMSFKQKTVHGRYFPLCGMNLAFKPKEWLPWCQFVDVPRFDDIWMGWLWQREAYRRGCCFNLAGPLVRHARQSDVWHNLKLEAKYLRVNETLWREIAMHDDTSYDSLRGLLPC